MAKNDTERFGAVPYRFYESLHRGEITPLEFFLGSYLVGEANYVTHRLTRTVTVMTIESGWAWTPRHLRNALAKLRAGGWIDYTVSPRQRKPYVITLTGLRLRHAHDDPADRDDDITF